MKNERTNNHPQKQRKDHHPHAIIEQRFACDHLLQFLRCASGLGSSITEFVEDHVFPGGELVHASDVLRAAAGSRLECLDAENLRPHYGKTLWHWVTRLEQHADVAPHLIGEQNYRIWHIYMAGSAHAFDRGWMELWWVLAGKGIDDGQPNYPFRRDFIYRGE